MATFERTIKYKGLELVCIGYYCKGSRGARGKYGEPLEPDDPEEFEIENVYHGEDDIIGLLSNKAIEEMSSMIYDS